MSSSNVVKYTLQSRVPETPFQLSIHNELSSLQLSLATTFIETIRFAIKDHGFCTLGISGGSLPANLGAYSIGSYPYPVVDTRATSSDRLLILTLSAFIGAGLRLLESKGVDISDIDWSKCHAFLVDERCVPLDHDDRYVA